MGEGRRRGLGGEEEGREVEDERVADGAAVMTEWRWRLREKSGWRDLAGGTVVEGGRGREAGSGVVEEEEVVGIVVEEEEEEDGVVVGDERIVEVRGGGWDGRAGGVTDAVVEGVEADGAEGWRESCVAECEVV